MCVVSVFSSDNRLVVTHNRDEFVFRDSSDSLVEQQINGITVFFPLDEVSKGTWFVGSKKYVGCILNGAIKKHNRNLPYSKSRGRILLELFNYPSISHFLETFDFKGYECFTLVLIDLENKEESVIVWDENKVQLESLEKPIFVRSSSTLYNQNEKEKHKTFFTQESFTDIMSDKVLDKHKAIKLNLGAKKPLMKTVSFTQFIWEKEGFQMKYLKQ